VIKGRSVRVWEAQNVTSLEEGLAKREPYVCFNMYFHSL